LVAVRAVAATSSAPHELTFGRLPFSTILIARDSSQGDPYRI
jgi:hypothetical protein